MDFEVCDSIKRAIVERVEHGVFGYTFAPPEYRESISNWWMRRHGVRVDPDWIVHVPGVVSGIAVSLLTFTDPDDGVIVQPPVYWPFFEVVEENGRRVVENPLVRIDGTYKMDLEDMKEKLKDARAFILCSPHNPVGRVWSEDELESLVEVLRGWDGVVVSDEIHMDFVFSGKFKSMIDSNLDRLIVLSSPNKTFNIPGLKGGYAVIPNDSMRREFVRTLRALHISSPNTVVVHATIAAYNECEGWLDETLDYIRHNMEMVKERLEDFGVGVYLPEGTYLMWLDFLKTDLEDPFTEILKAGVWLQNGEYFGRNGRGYLRMNVATGREVLVEALDRISRVLQI